MADANTIVTGDRYLTSLLTFISSNAGALIDGTLTLKLNPVGLHYVHSRLEALAELERLISGAPVDYLRAYISDLGDHRALEQLRRILCRVTEVKVVSVLGAGVRDPTPVCLGVFGRLRVLELRGCDLSRATAKGLIELRECLERLVCHNSTDALRHVFASRIADIKDSPQWTQLSFVSCACNGLKLMDESLQLLPAIEILDLSRNRFAKVDNLRKCTKLKHLDLGFNQLRSVLSLSEVTTHISKLVLRNNALTTLQGLENLKSLEDLDLSYNIISNFSEFEVLSGIPSLKNLWLEGNPLSCDRWYRPHVYSYFGYPDMLIQLKVDDKKITTKEFWKRQIIISRRQKKPASYGFYFPVRENAKEEASVSTKTKKMPRVACLENEGSSISSEHETKSHDKEIHSGDENNISDKEGEIVGFQNKIELMSKERSRVWLQDLNEWMDQASGNAVFGSKTNGATLDPRGDNYVRVNPDKRHIGDNSRHISILNQASKNVNCTKILETDTTFADSSYSFTGSCNPETSKLLLDATHHESEHTSINLDQNQSLLSSSLHERTANLSLTDGKSDAETYAAQRGYMVTTGVNAAPLSMESHHGPPPHYQEDILHRRQYLEEEYLQLSVDSLSVASSDSDTSSEEDESIDSVPVSPETEHILNPAVNRDIGPSSLIYAEKHNAMRDHANGKCLDPQTEQLSSLVISGNGFDNPVEVGEEASSVTLEMDGLDLKRKKKPKKRVVSLLENNAVSTSTELGGMRELVQTQIGDTECWLEGDDEMKHHVYDGSLDKENIEPYTHTLAQQAMGVLPEQKHLDDEADGNVKDLINSILSGSGANETCIEYIICDSLLYLEVQCMEREVVVLTSSERKFYVLPRNLISRGSGNAAGLVTSYKAEDVSGVLVGLGLQVVRLFVRGEAAHLFMTRSAEKSELLLSMLEFVGSSGANNGFHLSSLEQVQIGLFYKHICGGSEMSIYQYSMVLFRQHIECEEGQWVSRSLFISGGWLFVCIEDISLFSSHLMDDDFPLYLSLDSSCCIRDINKMVVEVGEKRCSISISQSDQAERDSESCLSAVSAIMGSSTELGRGRKASETCTWQLKWFCEDNLSKFVALIKALHSEVAMSILSISYVS